MYRQTIGHTDRPENTQTDKRTHRQTQTVNNLDHSPAMNDQWCTAFMIPRPDVEDKFDQ